MTLIFAIRVIYWSRPTSHLSSKCSSLKHCQIISFLVLKVMVTLTMTFACQCHLLVRTYILSKFEGPIPKHCQVIKLFHTKGPGDLDVCPQDHLLVRTNISTKFEGPNHKHCRTISFCSIKGHSDL